MHEEHAAKDLVFVVHPDYVRLEETFEYMTDERRA